MRNFFKLDWILLVVVTLLIAIGLAAIYGLSFNGGTFDGSHFYRQLLAVFLGGALLIFFSFYDYRALNTMSTKLYFLALVLLLAVILLGSHINGTTGWLRFGGFSFQPVELVKLIMIIFLASFLSKKKNELSVLVRIIASIVLIGIPILLILKQPDFGSAMIVIGIWMGMIVVSGINKKHLLILFLIGIVAAGSSWFFLKDYQKERIINFVRPNNDPHGSGYNVLQATVAVGSGGVWGKGLGNGSQSQLNFLPEKYTDFIFAAIGEELGLAGSVIVFILFVVIIYRLKEAARLARDNFGYLLSVGIIMMIFLQILVNAGMNIGVAPVAGVPLPFLSYGGSSMITLLASVGLIQSVYARRIKTLD